MGDFNQDISGAEVYPPSDAMRSKSWLKTSEEYTAMYKESIDEPEKFWGEIGRSFHWETPFSKAGPTYNFARSKGKIETEWFPGGKTNISYNCLDRHVQAGHGDRTAIFHECNDIDDPAHKVVTYQDMLALVCKASNALLTGNPRVRKGDRVSIYMPMTPELPAVMLACARIGAVHSVVFGGFSASALANRIADAQSSVLITADAVMRGAKPIQLKAISDEACEMAAKDGFKVGRVVCLQRLGNTAQAAQAQHAWNEATDVWFHDWIAGMPETCEPEWMDSEDPLFMLYTSGSTGKPKGVVHTTAGYMVGAYLSTKYTFDLHLEDVFFCTADCGWITGHSYIAYGPLLNCATQVVFEGVPNFPDAGRLWGVCDKYKVSAFYTAPTAIRALMRSGDEPVTKHSRASLKVLGTVGEPINPEAWKWYYNVIGDGRCPIVDTYWQTETGSHLLTPLPGCINAKPGSACVPFFGVEPAIVDDKSNELSGECSGQLVLKRPIPSMLRTIFGDHERFETTYFSQHDGYYFTGDGAKRDADGYYWLTGRVDDVINVSGHRIGTAEVESALVGHGPVAEAAVVGFPHEIKGEGIWAYVTLKDGVEYTDALKQELKNVVREVIGAFAQPDQIHWAPQLPKTRSGKIMRRVLRKLALPTYLTEDLGDTSTLADPAVVEALKDNHPLKA